MNIYTSSFICLLAYLFSCLLPQLAWGDTVTNDNYSIDVNTIDTNPQPTPKSQVLGVSSKTTPEFTTGPNYTVNATNDSVSVGLSQNIIDLGILSSTNPVIRTSDLLLSTPATGGQILSYENHPLATTTNDLIQNTSCDNGSCSSEIAALWNNTLTYGFGYRCTSTQQNVCDSQFSPPNYYKQFSVDSLNQLPEPIITNVVGSTASKASVTYKVNISGTQKTGAYYNSITYLAIPNF